MSKLRRFEILFANPEQVYFAGQEVSGRIIIETSEVRKVTDVLFELKGRARTYWTLESGKNSAKNCAGSEPYFCEQFNTGYTKRFPASEEGKGRQLPAGTHEIPFTYTLPKSLPTSFEGEFGHVRYTCKATFQRPWDVDVLCERAFTVIGIEDINDQSDLLTPATASSSSLQRHCFCVRQGSIDVELGAQRSGFTPGDVIQINGRIRNRSQRPIRSSILKLVQHVTYRAKTFAGQEHTKTTAKDVVKLEKGEIPAHSHSSTQWDVERLIIPAVPPRLSKCRIMEVRYSLELEVNPTTRCALPITIGTIPLLSDMVDKALKNGRNKESESEEAPPPLISPTSTTSGEDAVVQVTITDESGRTGEMNLTDRMKIDDGRVMPDQAELDESLTMILSKKRVRMPSSILSELYPSLPSPYYRESFSGRVDISDEKETCEFGESLFAPKYPFYND